MTGEVVDTGAANPSEVDFVALQPGQTIGRYTVVSVLGQGGFGITYRARDTQLDREVAIKEYLPTAIAVRQGGETVLPRSTKVAEDFTWGRERFVSEGRTLASLHHAPGIVRVFDFLEINGTAYIVMELLHGETLEDRIKKQGPFDAAAIDRVLTPLLAGLEEVHKAGFLHRDIKPANILLNANGDPTLIDFGASRAAMAGRSVAMTAVFTPGYAAAEQMTSAKQGPWTDIYALSATLHHAITGKAPPNAFDRMLDDEYEPLGKAAPPGFSRGLLAGIDAGLAVRASDRPQSIAGWRPLLSMVSAGADDVTRNISRTSDPSATVVTRSKTVQPQPSPARTPPTQAPPAAAPKSRTPLYAGVAVAILLVAGGGGWLALSPSKPAPPPAPAQAQAQASTLQDMKVEDLERVLTERRAADAAAAEKKRQEDEARRKADTEAAAKVAADADLAKAEAARKQAETELAKLKAEIETRRLEDTQAQALARRAEAESAQRRAEAEMAALRQAEADARQKAAAEAEATRQADEALARAQAERQKADEEAKVKAAAEAKEKGEASAKQVAEAEAKAKVEADVKAKAEAEARTAAESVAAAKKAAETAETGLRLAQTDRQRIQVALTSLGFDTRGSDGTFGPRSREMIAAWQKSRNHPDAGFLNGTQHQALLREATPALSKYEEEQKKVEEEKKKAEDAKRKADEEAKARTAAAAPAPPAAAPAGPAGAAPSPPTGFDGAYGGSVSVPGGTRPMTIRITGATGSGTMTHPVCGAAPLTVRVSPAGDLSGDATAFDNSCSRVSSSISGRVANGQIQFNISGPGVRGSGTLARGAAAPAQPAAAVPQPNVAAPATAPAPVGGGFDGTYSGSLTQPAFSGHNPTSAITIRVAGASGTGAFVHSSCGTVPVSIRVSPTGDVSGDGAVFDRSCGRIPSSVSGRISDGRMQIAISGPGARASASLTRGAAP